MFMLLLRILWTYNALSINTQDPHALRARDDGLVTPVVANPAQGEAISNAM